MGTQSQALPKDDYLEAASLKILLLEDDAVDAHWVARCLKKVGQYSYSLHVLSAVDRVIAYMAEKPVDVVVMDLNLPDSQGWQTVKQVADASPGVPIVVLSGQADFETVREALLAGAQTFQMKDSGTEQSLAQRIDFAIRRKAREIELARKFIDAPI
jgi:DNA-binding NarL/FixJ family response regulator